MSANNWTLFLLIPIVLLSLSSCFLTPLVEVLFDPDNFGVVDGDATGAILLSASVLNMGIDEQRALSYLIVPSTSDANIELSYGSSESGAFELGTTHAHFDGSALSGAITEPGVLTLRGVSAGTVFVRISVEGVSRHLRVKVFDQVVDPGPFVTPLSGSCYCHPAP